MVFCNLHCIKDIHACTFMLHNPCMYTCTIMYSDLLLSSSIIASHWSSLGACNPLSLTHTANFLCRSVAWLSVDSWMNLLCTDMHNCNLYIIVSSIRTCNIIHWIVKCESLIELHAWCIWPSVHLWAWTAWLSALPVLELKGMGLLQRAFFQKPVYCMRIAKGTHE